MEIKVERKEGGYVVVSREEQARYQRLILTPVYKTQDAANDTANRITASLERGYSGNQTVFNSLIKFLDQTEDSNRLGWNGWGYMTINGSDSGCPVWWSCYDPADVAVEWDNYDSDTHDYGYYNAYDVADRLVIAFDYQYDLIAAMLDVLTQDEMSAVIENWLQSYDAISFEDDSPYPPNYTEVMECRKMGELFETLTPLDAPTWAEKIIDEGEESYVEFNTGSTQVYYRFAEGEFWYTSDSGPEKHGYSVNNPGFTQALTNAIKNHRMEMN